MTAPAKTVTDHLHEAQAVLTSGQEIPAPARMALAWEHVQQALDAIQHARCEAMTGLDKF